MSDHAGLIARLEAELAAARARQAAGEHTRHSEELQPEPPAPVPAQEPAPEPEQPAMEPVSPYYRSLHPDRYHEPHARVLASAHGAGGQAGLGAGLAN